MKKTLLYIKANGEYYYPQPAYKQDPNGMGYMPVCIIKKLLFGIWQVDYYDTHLLYNKDGNEKKHWKFGEEAIPNSRVLLYPSGIEEIKWAIG